MRHSDWHGSKSTLVFFSAAWALAALLIGFAIIAAGFALFVGFGFDQAALILFIGWPVSMGVVNRVASRVHRSQTMGGWVVGMIFMLPVVGFILIAVAIVFRL